MIDVQSLRNAYEAPWAFHSIELAENCPKLGIGSLAFFEMRRHRGDTVSPFQSSLGLVVRDDCPVRSFEKPYFIEISGVARNVKKVTLFLPRRGSGVRVPQRPLF